MSGKIYSKPVTFAVMATVVVLVGTVATMAYPLLRADMHPKVEGLRPLPALELAGRDVYQREGCVNCHTQTVRPLKSEVVRYLGNRAQEPTARYSLAGEFAYDHPFLWGSKRTGPDLAFEGWIKPSAAWQKEHLQTPQKLVARSNMPAYAFLDGEQVDGEAVQASMRALRRVGVPYTDADVAGAPEAVKGKTSMDALVAYVLSLGKAVNRGAPGGVDVDLATPNPLAHSVAAVVKGKQLFEANGCGACHGDEGHGQEGVAPDLVDDEFLGVKGDLPDAAYFAMIKGGSDVKAALGRKGVPDGGMQAFGAELKDEDIWAIVAWLRNQKGHEAAEGIKKESDEHVREHAAPPAPAPAAR
jgi:cytochrome c oxidase cbb3-type subunit 2